MIEMARRHDHLFFDESLAEELKRKPCQKKLDFEEDVQAGVSEQPAAPPRVSPSRSPPRVSPGRGQPSRVSPPRVSPPRVSPPGVSPPRDDVEVIHAPVHMHPFDAPITEDLPEPMAGPLHIHGWTTPPHLRTRLQQVQPPVETAHEQPPALYEHLIGAEGLTHQLQLQLGAADEFFDTEGIELLDDSLLPSSPVRPCQPCGGRGLTPPLTPPSPPALTPSPRAGDIFQEVGIQYSPRSQAFGPPVIPSFSPDWLEGYSPAGRTPGSPDRVVTQSSSNRRYVLRTPSPHGRYSGGNSQRFS